MWRRVPGSQGRWPTEWLCSQAGREGPCGRCPRHAARCSVPPDHSKQTGGTRFPPPPWPGPPGVSPTGFLTGPLSEGPSFPLRLPLRREQDACPHITPRLAAGSRASLPRGVPPGHLPTSYLVPRRSTRHFPAGDQGLQLDPEGSGSVHSRYRDTQSTMVTMVTMVTALMKRGPSDAEQTLGGCLPSS